MGYAPGEAFDPAEQERIERLFAPGALDEIERILGMTEHPNHDVRNALAMAIWHALRSYAAGGRPRIKTVRGLINDLAATDPECVRSAARALLMAEGGPNAAVADEAAFLIHLASGETISRQSLIDLAAGTDANAAEIATAARVALAKTPLDRGGNPDRLGDPERHVLLAKLAALFQQCRARRAGVTWNEYEQRFSGKFFRLYELVDAAVAAGRGTQPTGHHALGDFAKRWLPEIRKNLPKVQKVP
jgi:hypothetical protein